MQKISCLNLPISENPCYVTFPRVMWTNIFTQDRLIMVDQSNQIRLHVQWNFWLFTTAWMTPRHLPLKSLAPIGATTGIPTPFASILTSPTGVFFFFFCQLLSQLVLPSQWGIVNLIQFWSFLSCVCFLRLHTLSIERKTLQNKERQEAEESQLDRALLGSCLNMKPPCMAEDLPPVSFFLWTNITFASQLVLHSVTYQVPAPTKNLCWK